MNNNEVITTVFPTGDWNKVIIESDFIDEMAFKVFKLYYGDELVLDVVDREGCGVSWFDIKDLTNTKVRLTIFIDNFFVDFLRPESVVVADNFLKRDDEKNIDENGIPLQKL